MSTSVVQIGSHSANLSEDANSIASSAAFSRAKIGHQTAMSIPTVTTSQQRAINMKSRHLQPLSGAFPGAMKLNNTRSTSLTNVFNSKRPSS